MRSILSAILVAKVFRILVLLYLNRLKHTKTDDILSWKRKKEKRKARSESVPVVGRFPSNDYFALCCNKKEDSNLRR